MCFLTGTIIQDKYEPPAIGIQLPTFTDKAEFGAAMKQKHFLIDVRNYSVTCITSDYDSVICCI